MSYKGGARQGRGRGVGVDMLEKTEARRSGVNLSRVGKNKVEQREYGCVVP